MLGYISIQFKPLLQVNYVNTLLYSVSSSDFPCPGCGILYIFIAGITSKSALLMFTLLSARKLHFRNSLFIDNNIKCSYMIHRWLSVILQSILWGWLIQIDLITIFLKLTNERYIFCYSILNNNDNCTFDLFVSYMSFIIIVLAIFDPVICCHFCHNTLKQSKEDYNSIFNFDLYQLWKIHDYCYI